MRQPYAALIHAAKACCCRVRDVIYYARRCAAARCAYHLPCHAACRRGAQCHAARDMIAESARARCHEARYALPARALCPRHARAAQRQRDYAAAHAYVCATLARRAIEIERGGVRMLPRAYMSPCALRFSRCLSFAAFALFCRH